jgi:hypothetical protein
MPKAYIDAMIDWMVHGDAYRLAETRSACAIASSLNGSSAICIDNTARR